MSTEEEVETTRVEIRYPLKLKAALKTHADRRALSLTVYTLQVIMLGLNAGIQMDKASGFDTAADEEALALVMKQLGLTTMARS